MGGLSPTENMEKEQNKAIANDLYFTDMMSQIIGDKKVARNQVIIPPTGIPQQQRTREELIIHGVMESCTFRTVLSCVLGKWPSRHTKWENSGALVQPPKY
jgi:hypothetical protein